MLFNTLAGINKRCQNGTDMKQAQLDTAAYVAELMAIDKNRLPADGGNRFNRLIFARSPYLLQHAENPVKWHEWGEDAFSEARDKNLPLLLSIGYATCHWCHVMAHESFEDDEVASLLNRHFVSIKVDREERPDIDSFYMTVSQLLTGSGGWPLNVFITPDRRPFMAITYLPKRSRGGMSGFMDLLANIATLWRQRPDMIEKNCQGIMEELSTLRTGRQPHFNHDLTTVSKTAFEQLSRLYDAEYGGFGSAPKFPMPIYLRWLLEEGHGGNGEARHMALTTLRRMRAGGIWDQLAGGLHRYSVDRIWLAPHFEKMLYDQAMLAQVSMDAFQITGECFFSDLADEIFRFAEKELRSPEGAYFAALDADSEGVEGKFYLWSRDEISTCLGSDTDMFCDYFDVTSTGNFEGETILNIPSALEEFCQQRGLQPDSTSEILDTCRLKLLKQRDTRIRPLLDGKIITSWNGLMIAALARGGTLCGNREYLVLAEKAASFILTALRREDGRLLRSHLLGPSTIPAFLEDYAFLALGLLELYENTLDCSWLKEAAILGDEIVRLFRDTETGGFFSTGHDAEQMPTRINAEHDGVTPSALSATAQLLLRLGWTCTRDDLVAKARELLDGQRGELDRSPLGQLGTLQALYRSGSGPLIVTLSGSIGDGGLTALLHTLKRHFIPHLAIIFNATNDNARASMCTGGTCFAEVSSPSGLADVLRRTGTADY